MKSSLNYFAAVATVALAFSYVVSCPSAQAVGDLYADPGWTYAFDGDEAYYYDKDGPAPDYLCQSGCENNNPGGSGGTPALVDPTILDPDCDPSNPNDCGNAEWIHKSSQWEGSAPGDPLGDAPLTALPPIPGFHAQRPAAPGGVGTYTDNNTSYLRIQDPGRPDSFFWRDKGTQLNVGWAKQEGNNRKIQFGHNIANDAAYSEDPAVIDNGITISFRARIATAATGPLDGAYPEGQFLESAVIPWPTDGLGQRVANDGRGLFMITQSGGGQGSGLAQMGFGFVDENTIEAEGLAISKTGLVMNNPAQAGGDVDTDFATDTTVNMVEIDNGELTDWQEFWITVQAHSTPVEGNTHEVNVYHNGTLTPETFDIILSSENEFGTDPFLGMGLSSGTRAGAFDIDFFAYSEGILVPALAPEDADLDDDGDVDGFDFLLIQRNDPSLIPTWKSQFGTDSNLLGAASVPEPSCIMLMVAASACFGGLARRGSLRS